MNTKINKPEKKNTDFIKLIIENGYTDKSKKLDKDIIDNPELESEFKAIISDREIIDKPELESKIKTRILAIADAKKVLFN